MVADWNVVHYKFCGWYMDCPMIKCPSDELAMRTTLEPNLIINQSLQKSVEDEEVGTSRRGKRIIKKKSVVVEPSEAPGQAAQTSGVQALHPSTNRPVESDDGMESSGPLPSQDIPVLQAGKRSRNVSLPGPSSPTHKRHKPNKDVSQFSMSSTAEISQLPLTVRGMLNDLHPVRSSSSSKTKLINDSLVRWCEMKQANKENKWPGEFDEMLAFIKLVSNFHYHKMLYYFPCFS